MIVHAIKLCFFTGVDSYCLGRKPHTSRFFSPFRGEMVRTISAMIAVALEDLELRCRNQNLPVGKSAIRFEPHTQKSGTGEYLLYTIFSFFYATLTVIISNRGVCSSWEDMGRHTCPTTRSYSDDPQKTGPQARSWEKAGEIRDLGNSQSIQGYARRPCRQLG